MHREVACAKDAVGERDAQRPIRNLPILYAVAMHFTDGEARLRREIERIDSRSLDVEQKRVPDIQSRFLQPCRRSGSYFYERLNPFKLCGQLDGPPVEAIRRQRAAAGVDL